MKRATIEKVYSVGRSHRKYPALVEVWYKIDGTENSFLVFTLENYKRKVYIGLARIVDNPLVNLNLNLAELDIIIYKFGLPASLFFTEDPIQINNKYWENATRYL